MFEGYALNNVPGGSGAEARLLMKYAYLVKRAVAHLNAQVSSTVSQDDLEQIGLMGLLEFIRSAGSPDKYDDFERAAFVRIRGAILDELRRQDWRPRSVRQAANKLNHVRREMAKKLGRDPSEDELAKKTGLSHESIRDLIYADHAETMQTLEDWITNENPLPQEGELSQEERMVLLSKALGRLKERDRLIIALHYQKGLNFKEIAKVLDVVPSRITQLHKECLETLNNILKEK